MQVVILKENRLPRHATVGIVSTLNTNVVLDSKTSSWLLLLSYVVFVFVACFYQRSLLLYRGKITTIIIKLSAKSNKFAFT